MGDFEDDPLVVMMGCQAWTNVVVVAGHCPACHAGILPGHEGRYCARCDGLSPRREARVRAARRGIKAIDRATAAAKRTRDKLMAHRLVLSESERRRIWNGYRGSLAGACEGVTNLSATGRAWLIRIGQCPDFTLPLLSHARH